MSQRPVLTPEERALPYAKFYDLPITPIPAEKICPSPPSRRRRSPCWRGGPLTPPWP